MRIIAGKFKGRRLLTPRGRAIRPTADRIREAIFNILGNACRGLLVADLFAGSGALGLEALSRGAEQAVFVDRRRAAIDLIRRNIAACGCDTDAVVCTADVSRNLSCLGKTGRPVEMVFMDPPYQSGLITSVLNRLHHGRFIAPGAKLIVEHSQREALSNGGEAFRLDDQRRYGKTLVSFLAYMV